MIIQRPTDLAALIKSQRKSQGLTQQQLAQLTSLSQRSISSIEQSGEMHTSTLLRLLSALGVQLTANTDQNAAQDDNEVFW